MNEDWNQTLEEAGSRAVADSLTGTLDGVVRRVLLDGFERVGADEGTLWLADPGQSQLVPAFNSGPEAEKFVADFRQPLDRGVISLVYHSGQPFCENEVYKNRSHDETIDKALNVVTSAMIAAPLFFAHRPRGVVSCVKLRRPDEKNGKDPNFAPSHLSEMQRTVTVVERLIDWRLLHELLDLETF